MHHTLQTLAYETREGDTETPDFGPGDGKKNVWIGAIFWSRMKRGLLLRPPHCAAEPGSLRDYSVEQWDTCLVVFLHNTTDPMERLCLHLRHCVQQEVNEFFNV